MTISEYYRSYKKNRYPISLQSGQDKSLNEFFKNFIEPRCLKQSDVIKWHEMLMKYIERDDAIYWIRYYETGPQINGVFKNRRACLTEFEDGFKYVFVSNYDAQEIFRMISLGVTPDIDEFHNLMKNYQFPMHYDRGNSSEESQICAYPNIGNVTSGVLNECGYYLAHIFGIKAKYRRLSGNYNELSKREINHIYPRGDINDWKIDQTTNKKVRKLDYSLSNEEKNIVKAHFLRFIDPLNYFVVPIKVNCIANCNCSLGEYEPLIATVYQEYEIKYGTARMSEFMENALVVKGFKQNINNNSSFDVRYGLCINSKANNNFASGKAINSQIQTNISPIYLIPEDLNEFKNRLIFKQKAKITYLFSDQTYKEHDWSARNFSISSDVFNNIRSRTEYRQFIKCNNPKLIRIIVIVK